MYTRYHVWQEVQITANQSEIGWVNQFTTIDVCVDLRFMLKGYGWKPNIGDTNIPVLFEGSYKCYYRKFGDTDWIMFAQVVSERASTDDLRVYKDISVSIGDLPESRYEVKIVADKGEIFTSWGGVIEGIASSGEFWYSLFQRASIVSGIRVFEKVKVRELGLAYGEVLYPFVFTDVSIQELGIAILQHNIDVFDGSSILEEVTVFDIVSLVIDQIVNVAEDVYLWSDVINSWESLEYLYIYDWVSMSVNPKYIQPYESVSIQEWFRYSLNPFSMPVHIQDVLVNEDVLVDFVLPYGHVHLIQNIIVNDWVSSELWAWILQDECSGTLGNWSQSKNIGDEIIEENPSGNFHLQVSSSLGSPTAMISRSLVSTAKDYEMEVKVKFRNLSGNHRAESTILIQIGDYAVFSIQESGASAGYFKIIPVVVDLFPVFYVLADVWYRLRLRVRSRFVELYFDDVLVGSDWIWVTNTLNPSIQLWSSNTLGEISNLEMWLEYIYVRNFNRLNTLYMTGNQSVTISEVKTVTKV